MRSHHLAPALLAVTAFVLSACGAHPPAPSPGRVILSIDGGPAMAAVTRVAISVAPAGVSADLALDQATGAFTGTLALPAGAQVITARAFAGATLVAEGSASVTVTGGETMTVAITVLDVTGPDPTPDHAPILTALAASAATLEVGQSLTLDATAVDVDADPITFTWSASPAGCATFSPASSTSDGAASTSATAALAGPCTLSVEASAKGLVDTLSTSVEMILPVVINGTFVPQPVIGAVEFLAPAAATVLRSDADATVRQAWTQGAPVTVRVSWDATPWLDRSTATLTDGCGGAVASLETTATSETFEWTPTGGPVCVLSARVTRQGLTDLFPVAVLVTAPPPSACAWTQLAAHDLTTLPPGAVGATGSMGGQGAAQVAGRSAWLQTSDWNWVTMPSPFGAQDVVAMEADVYLPAFTGVGRHASLHLFNDPDVGNGLGTHGVMAILTSLDAATTSLDWWFYPTAGGAFDRRTPVVVAAETWHRFRLEASRSACTFRALLDGIELDRFSTVCDTGGGTVTFSSNSFTAVPSNVAWSNLRMETGTAACAP